MNYNGVPAFVPADGDVRERRELYSVSVIRSAAENVAVVWDVCLREHRSSAILRASHTLVTVDHLASRTAFSAARSFRFARRIAADMNGATILEKPDGVPRFVSVIRVPV